jgi:putative FmdB family regulatory protein
MPTYDYVCDKCNKTFEIWQRISETPLTLCPDKTCGGHIMRTIGGGAGFIFKGSGFYVTDYRSGDYKKQAQSESSSSSPPLAGTGTSASTADTKPKSTGESKP